MLLGHLVSVTFVLMLCAHECNGDHWPPFWFEVPGTLEEFPVTSGATVIDPWNYLHRMGLYKILLRETQDVMVSFGPNNTGNILWGLPIQHGWQLSSGRLRNFQSNFTNCPNPPEQKFCISVTSWWAGINYYLSVVPFIGAINAEYFRTWPYEIVFLKPSVPFATEITSANMNAGGPFSGTGERYIPDMYCVTIDECLRKAGNATTAWTDFFVYLKNVLRGKTLGYNNNVTNGRSQLEDDILKRMWLAHIDSLDDALNIMDAWLPLMSEPEQDFGLNWANAVDFLAATLWPTDFATTTISQEQGLPKRVLVDGDIPPNIPDMTPDVNGLLVLLHKINYYNGVTNGALLKVWKRCNCSPEGRKYGRELMANADRPLKAFTALMGLLYETVVAPCDM